MIVIGVDVHKQSVTAVAVDEVGRPLAETTSRSESVEVLGRASALARIGCGRSRTAGMSPGGSSGNCSASAKTARPT